MGRLHLRREFERVRREGRTVRSGPLSVRYVEDAAAVPPRVAFAIPRKVGTAVIRNRVRRRLRALVRERDLVPGLYLVRVAPAAAGLDAAALRAHLERTTVDASAGR